MVRSLTLSLLALLLLPASAHAFVRGDTNDDGAVNIADVVFSLNYLFVPGSPQPVCLDALDENDDGTIDLGDPVQLATFLFSSGAPPAPPYPMDGTDPTPDPLGDCGGGGTGTDLPFTLLVSGQLSGLIDSSDPDFCPPDPVLFTTLVRNQADWDLLWAEHTSIVFPPPPEPVVDFTMNNVLIVLASVNTGGYDVSVTDVTEYSDHVDVNLTLTDPTGCIVFFICSQPFQMLTIPVLTTTGDAVPIVTTQFPCP